ncbi:hypothetical protein [Haloarcula salina]|uniref:Uncharacterized protein n=1 Tax=Haloarcula salina TaxID=1429914 RepID=A0AA41KG64_9EURY|nr:hypothetical protein [Haloarcula salina]MBV0902757.1 hypothetical protein [Haloarcula salina]
MIVSAAFGQLTDVLDGIESSAVEIQRVEVPEREMGDEAELTAEMTVSVPALPGLSLGEDVSIDGDSLDSDGRIEIDLSVTVPADAEVAAEYGLDEEPGSGRSPQSSVPAYKDPEALAAVYEEYGTFPEMTEALDVDVTSETVRRYMVEYDIHDPTDNTPHPGEFEFASTGSDDDATEADGADTTGETAADSVDASPDGDGSEQAESAQTSELGRRSVAALLTESDGQGRDDNLVADGIGISESLTVADLATAVNRADSVHEVTRQLGMSRGNTRRLLRELDLVTFVTHPLGASQIAVSEAEIKRRIDTASS